MPDVRDFMLPDLGEGLEEGEIVTWLVAVGDRVELNQPLVEVETAKAVVEVPSPFSGTVLEQVGEAGQTIEVGSLLCRIDTAGGATTGVAVDGANVSAAPDGTAETSFEERAAEVEARSGFYGEIKGAKSVLDADDEPQPLVGYGQSKAGARRRRRGGKEVPARTGSDGSSGSARPLAKPPVRKLAKELGVLLTDIAPGSGPGGIVTREDVRAHAEAHEAMPDRDQTPASTAEAAATTRRVDSPASTGGQPLVAGFRGRTPGEVEHVKGIRKRIIAKMEESRRDIPHALCSRDADLTDLWELRGDLTAMARAAGFEIKITPFTLICRATLLALRRFPTLNARYDQAAGEIRLLEDINLGVAVDTDRGLIVPNIKDAHRKSTLELALETVRLSTRCRDGSATPAELTGGTFTVDNYGYFGNDDGNPIINAPEVGILGVGTIRPRPWIHEDEVVERRVCRFTLAFDHRVSDGGEAGRFVTYVAELCENPARILLHS